MKPEVLKVIIGLLVASVLIFSILLAKEEGVRKKKGLAILYILIAGLFIGILGFFQYFGLKEKPFYFFIVLQLFILAIGIIHIRILKKTLSWTSNESIIGEFLVTLNTAVAGGFFLLLTFSLLGANEFSLLMLSALVWFFVPFFFIKSMDFYLTIPERIYKTWSYPIDNPIPDPTDSELASPMVISFEFQKKVNQEDFTIFRAKAPKDIQFGKLFYFFINDYNSRHPESTIEVSSKSIPFPWVFQFKPKLFARFSYLDPDETVYHNQIKENSVIVCHRILEP
jgi:hypothetical protein